jgi:hypothetical protein
LFRYIRYNGLGLRRAALEHDEAAPSVLADLKGRTPRHAKRIGTLDPETSLIIWQDEVVETSGLTLLGLENSPANPAPLSTEPQIESV